MTILQALQYGTETLAKTSDSPILDAEVLLSFVLKCNKTFLFTYPEKKLNYQEWQKYKKLILRRRKYEPIAYIIHHKEFYGLDFYVNKNVLIPRPKTEKLVEKVINYIKNLKIKIQKIKICDVGTGSGCIAITLAKNLPKTTIYAIDISKNALKIAKFNAKKHKVLKHIKFIYSNLFSKIPKNIKFDVIVANLPYLSKRQYENTIFDIKKYEPKIALLGGKNGNEIYKKFFLQTKKYLKPGGKVFFEN